MKIAAIIQARMGSQRFPGKVIHEIDGKPMLSYLLERVAHCNSLDDIIVATTKEEDDSQIADFCKGYGVACYRGSLVNVASRFKAIIEIYGLDGFVRLSGDSPLLDQQLIDKAVEILRQGDLEIVTNIQTRTYPKGQSIEALKASTFVHAYKLMHDPEDLEHATKFFYKNSADFKIFNFTAEENNSAVQLAVDTPQDIKIITSIIKRMEGAHWQYGLDDVLKIYQEIVLYRI